MPNMMAFGDGPLGMIRSDEVMKAEPQVGISILIKKEGEQSSRSLSLSFSVPHGDTVRRGRL